MTVANSEFVEAAYGSGATTAQVLARHVLPNSLTPVLALATLQFGTAILQLSILGFLGYGAPPPTPEWGLIIADGRDFMAVKSLGRTGRELFTGWVLLNDRGRPVRCADARRYVDRETETAVARIPRRCLGFPEWVRVGAGAQTFEETRRSFSLAIDDGLLDGDFADRLTLSPRVLRGDAPI